MLDEAFIYISTAQTASSSLRRMADGAAPMSPQRYKRHRRHTSSVSLPNDIIFDILSRVPVDSACRFRCVSKEWCELITDQGFLAAHKSRHAEPLILVTSFRDKPSDGHDLRLVDLDGNVLKVINNGRGSWKPHTRFNNLICVTDDYTGAYVIDPCNPEALLTCKRTPHEVWRGVTRSTDTTFGFGRAAPCGVYKMVRFIDGLFCQIFTVGDGVGWRRAEPPPTPVTYYSSPPVVVDGILHVLASPEEMPIHWVCQEMGGDTIHCFDLESERWKDAIEGPQKLVGRELWKKTTKSVRIADRELNGLLCIVQSEVRFTNIWLRTDSSRGVWVKAYTIPMERDTYIYMPLRMTHDGRRLLFHCSLSRSRLQLVRSYDACTDKCTDVVETPGNLTSRINICNLHLDSLVSAKI